MMAEALLTSEMQDELSQRAHELYDRTLRSQLEPTHNGAFVAIHLDSGSHAVGATSSAARFALREQFPTGMIVTTKIGPLSDDTLARRILASQITVGSQK